MSLLDLPTLWNASGVEALDSDLFEYFCCVASGSLPTFGHDATALRNILVRTALEGETASAAAVLQALLAFSSLHRYGLQPQALELKITALGSLAKGSFTPGLGTKETIEHIAAGMLLSSFEVHQSSCTSGHWTGYLGGVKTITDMSSVKTLLQFSSDVAVLLDWVHYHNVLARFSLLYWNGEETSEFPSTPTNLLSSQDSSLPPPIYSMMDLLSQICDLSNSAIPTGTSDEVDNYKGFLKVLDWRIRSLPIKGDNDGEMLLMKLYQLALLLFLNRSFEGLIDQPIRMQQQIGQAFAILPRLSSCRQQFPIYVIGCEARTDEQRAAVLDLITKTEKMSTSRSFNHCRTLLQAVWTQDDLAEWDDISYRAKLTLVISRCAVAPIFV
uniref:Transcription factor iacI n=2 Tax=Pestalotiopsis fici (strain W106-1 / CGMCC3.15140) TaxID=1229662 RepID=IACI_PESFW|nr:RecName: Full=Transcription factor iacI; AltName: Full=Iso-A82775C biosynthesis cluster protein I [Pestalotiopsis fici W106-1]APC57600.1 regulator [Pestalotiopsis fici]